MKNDTVRANINVNKLEWELFKILSSKHLTHNDDGSLTPTTASNTIREFIWEYLTEESHHCKELLEELKKIDPNNPLVAYLEESKKEYNEALQPEDKEWGT